MVFMQQYFQLMIIANRVRQTDRSLIILLELLRAQWDMLYLGSNTRTTERIISENTSQITSSSKIVGGCSERIMEIFERIV